MNWAGTCDNFASDSEYGPYGRQIVDEFSTQKYETLINGSADLKMECPGYDAMDRESKIELWVTIFAGMAFNESSCQENPEKHRGPHGFLSGIFQLHKGMEDKYSKTCIKNAGATVENSIPCTMAMLRNQLDDAKIVNGKPDEGKLFAKHSYWEVLRPQAKIKKADKIKKAVKLFPKCSSLKAS